jgi:hypothetical protein
MLVFYWTAKDKEGSLNDIGETIGITPDQLIWEIDRSHCTPNIPPQPVVCSGSRYIGKPVLPDDFTVSNPKNIISGRLPNITTFQGQSDTLASLATSDLYLGDTNDVVDGASMLVPRYRTRLPV